MATINKTQLKALMDSIGKAFDLHETTVGTATTVSTMKYGAQQRITGILAYADAELVDELLYGHREVLANLDTALMAAKIYEPAIKAIAAHLGGIDTWWASNGGTDRIPPGFAKLARAIGQFLTADYVWPFVISLGTFAVTGSGTGTYTDGDEVDTTLYGAADIEAEATTLIGAADIVITALGTNQFGQTLREFTGTLVKTSPVGTKVDLTAANVGDRCVDLTNVTITGGTNLDAFKVQVKYDRSLSL